MMTAQEIEPLPFILQDQNGTKKISQRKLIDFLELKGFNQVILDGERSFIRNKNGLIKVISINDITDYLRELLEGNKHVEAYDIFAQNTAKFAGRTKMMLLKTIRPIDDRDFKNHTRFYFQNLYCEVTAEDILINQYAHLQGAIWENRIIDRSYNEPANKDVGQFEQFCINITGNDAPRFEALKSFMGYLLHRNKERGENRAVILYDEEMGVGNRANGRTGKTLLGKAIEQCRDLIYYDGKTTNFKGNFIYQRITHSTDVVYYDDLPKNTEFETFYSFLTTGIQVEKKFKQAFYIKGEKAPKLLISSNHYVRGDGGASDLARRYEFEIRNYYNKDFTPEQEFGTRFFGEEWSDLEWNKFFKFMMQCIQTYLSNGLTEAEPINLRNNKIADSTCKEFLEFAEAFFVIDERMDKRELHSSFKLLFPLWEDLSSNLFTRWCKMYADHVGLFYRDKPSGGEFYFWLNSEYVADE